MYKSTTIVLSMMLVPRMPVFRDRGGGTKFLKIVQGVEVQKLPIQVLLFCDINKF